MVTRQRKNKGKDKDKSTKVVWRISASAPLGEYVHSQPDALPAPTPTAAEVKVQAKGDGTPKELTERGWHHSTHELTHGMDMSEEPLDALPDDLFDQFFKKDPSAPSP